MKFDKNKTFPYPVLRPYCDDYIDAEFQTTVDFEVAKDSLSADISYNLSSDEIQHQISVGNAKFVSIVSCRDTYFREVLESDETKILAKFDLGSLRGEVRVDSYIVAVKLIPQFCSADINQEFGRDSFSYSPGDVLAQDETQLFYMDRDLFKPVTSVFELVKNDSLSGGEWKVGLEEEHVQIEVSPQMKESMDYARNDKTNQIILLNSIYIMAVMQTLQKLKEGEGDYDDKRWARVIKEQLHNFGWDLAAHDPYILAQRLMKYPLALLDTYVLKGKD
jgi:hypothetical protein